MGKRNSFKFTVKRFWHRRNFSLNIVNGDFEYSFKDLIIPICITEDRSYPLCDSRVLQRRTFEMRDQHTVF